MGKKKKNHPDLDEILQRPWCYYCERDFDDLKILINHQKAKHFKCDRCGRRLNTAGGLSVHMTQVHKESLSTIDNALANRASLDVEIFGMEGIPEDIVTAHNQRVIGQFAQAEAERRAATGNTPGGTNGVKKPKFESPSDLKKRLAEHKAKMAEEKAAGVDSGNVTPLGAGLDSQSPGLGQSPGPFQAGSPSFGQPPIQYGAPANSSYQSFPQAYNQQGPSFQQPQQPSPFAPPGVQQQQFPTNQPFAPPSQYQQSNGPSGPGYSPPNQYGAPPFQNGPSQFSNSPPQPFNAASSPIPYQQGQFQPPRIHSPQSQFSQQRPPASLSPAPGLPQRPAFGAPPVNAFQMQQMHQGQIPGPLSPPQTNTIPPKPSIGSPETIAGNPTSLDDLVSGAAQEADKAYAAAAGQVETKAEETQEEKRGKKEKDKNMRLVYSDNEVSPEEKMAHLPRYAFVPKRE
ncbi:MAG: hypothetical protein Q9167_007874 [Letrouitia subvulpina]